MGVFDLLLKKSFQCGMEYEFWPAPDENSKKLLIVLHGRGDSPEGFHFLPQALDIDAFNVLFLQAPDPYYTGFSWYDLPPSQAPGILRSRKLLFDLLGKLQSELGLRSLDVFLLGFSQGCLMVVDVALRYPKLLGGIIGLSGYVFFEEEYPTAFSKVAKEQRIWISHGLQDEMLPFEKTRESVERLRKLGISIDWNPVNKAHTVDEVDEIPHIRLFLTHQLEAN